MPQQPRVSPINDPAYEATPAIVNVPNPIGLISSTTFTRKHADEPEVHSTHLKYRPGKWDVWMLGITIVIGGQYFSWNAGISAGLYSYFICYVLIGTAYLTLCCCTSEISGALPFAGGAYGLARCTLGFFPAFVIGCCEALEYITYVSTSVLALTDMIVEVAPGLRSLKPLVWAAFYITSLYVHIRGDRYFWLFNMVIGTISTVILLLYCFGSLVFVDFGRYAASDPTITAFGGGGYSFMRALPLACWFFVGVEALNLASDQVARPKQTIPFAQVACVVTLLVTGIMVFFVTVSLPPGLASLPGELVPFNLGFELLFNIEHKHATILSLPATYATAFGFMWCYGKLIAAMATSRLLPVYLSRSTRKTAVPYAALIGGSLLSYLICLLVYVSSTIAGYLFSVCITSAFMSYTGQSLGYISLKLNYRNIKSSSFKSPFGIAGAVYSMLVWIAGIISIAGFQGNQGREISFFVGVVLLLTVYYFAWAKKRQTFSAQENRILLVTHVTKFNRRRHGGLGSKNKHSSRSQSKKRTTNCNSHYTNAETAHAVPDYLPSRHKWSTRHLSNQMHTKYDRSEHPDSSCNTETGPSAIPPKKV